LAYSVLNDGTVRFPKLATQALLAITWATSCAGASLGLLGAFRHFACRRQAIVDSLNTNSFSIYLVHYPVVHWIQFALLFVSWPTWIKFGVAFIGGIALSWGISTVLRRIPAVRRVL